MKDKRTIVEKAIEESYKPELLAELRGESPIKDPNIPLPCPFCGKTDALDTRPRGFPSLIKTVECTRCDTGQILFVIWQRRPREH